jgi:hypothetical protein
MRPGPIQTTIAVLGIGLSGLYYFAQVRPKPTSDKMPPAGSAYFAEQTSDCGVDLLNLAESESGPFKRVLPVGPNRPREKLRRNVWEQGRYRIQGRFTGKSHAFQGCASFSEFEVLEFRPWGPVQRCASPGALDSTLLLYTGDLPKDRYAPEDFLDGPWPPSIDDGACRRVGACLSGLRRADSRTAPDAVIDGEELPARDGGTCNTTVTCSADEKQVNACSGYIWCCRLLSD